MIQRFGKKNLIDIHLFLKENRDKYQDFYITVDKRRVFINNNDLIEKLLKYHEVYGILNKDVEGLLIIYKNKGFRPYIKLLTKSVKEANHLAKFINWNFANIELFAKVKKDNPLNNTLQRNGFEFIGDRGQEILLKKPKKFRHKTR